MTTANITISHTFKDAILEQYTALRFVRIDDLEESGSKQFLLSVFIGDPFGLMFKNLQGTELG